MSRKGRRGDAPEESTSSDESVIRPGGLVDPDALRAMAPARDEALDDSFQDEFDDDAPRKVSFCLSRDLKKRLDKYLTDRIPFMSRTQLQRLIENEQVRVNDRVPKASTVLRQGDRVEVLVPPPPPSGIQPERIELDVLHEDEHIIVINKLPGIIVHPARSHNSGTMINALAWHFAHASEHGGELSAVGGDFARPGVVHRLDKDTSGVIVFAKCDEAHWKLASQFEHRTVQKRYLALVHGNVEPLHDVIELPIGPHPNRARGYRERQVVRHDEAGKRALTIYRVIERFEGFSLVEVELRTGRTHQIRVHLAHLGWPLVGDDMYGGTRLTPQQLGASDEVLDVPGRGAWEADGMVIGRQALHASILEFAHPITRETMRFSADAPCDVWRVVGVLRDRFPGEGFAEQRDAWIDPRTIAPHQPRG
ncbi:MAG: RluA family pseudouridine synthase [Phycisphaerales bacterium JB043]